MKNKKGTIHPVCIYAIIIILAILLVYFFYGELTKEKESERECWVNSDCADACRGATSYACENGICVCIGGLPEPEEEHPEVFCEDELIPYCETPTYYSEACTCDNGNWICPDSLCSVFRIIP